MFCRHHVTLAGLIALLGEARSSAKDHVVDRMRRNREIKALLDPRGPFASPFCLSPSGPSEKPRAQRPRAIRDLRTERSARSAGGRINPKIAVAIAMLDP